MKNEIINALRRTFNNQYTYPFTQNPLHTQNNKASVVFVLCKQNCFRMLLKYEKIA